VTETEFTLNRPAETVDLNESEKWTKFQARKPRQNMPPTPSYATYQKMRRAGDERKAWDKRFYAFNRDLTNPKYKAAAAERMAAREFKTDAMQRAKNAEYQRKSRERNNEARSKCTTATGSDRRAPKAARSMTPRVDDGGTAISPHSVPYVTSRIDNFDRE
jgi:hypothetical protein